MTNATETQATRGRVLVVESNTRVREALAGLLADEGFAVSSVGSREESALAARDVRPDVIVLDVGLDAPGAPRDAALPRHGGLPSIPVVALSAYGVVGEAPSCGFSCGHLLQQVDRAVARKRSGQAA